ncbi:MAG TPA: PAS domain-containing protein [Cyclobacteriaceae bacterium]|nr:PAS domain-containing protein [Cyclobacteriaceae bacterium]
MTGSAAPELPNFARFLLENHLDEVANVALQISRDLNIPLLKQLQMPDEDLINLIKPGYTELLNSFIDGTSDALIQKGVASWMANQLPIIERDQVVSDDIPLVAQARKRLFLHFLPRYTKDINKVIAIVNEIDNYLSQYTAISYGAYANILQARIEKHVTELRNSDKLFKQAQAVTHIGNYVWDLHTKLLTWSDELYRIYEIEPKAQINSEALRNYNHPDDNIVVDTSIGNSITTGEPFNFYYRIRLGDGREKTLHARGEVEYDDKRQPVKIFGTAQDVTEQKAIEKRLEENQTFILKIADAAPSVITSYNLQTGQYLFVSQGLKNLLGHSPQQVLDEGIAFFMRIIHPDDLGPLMEKNAKAVEAANANWYAGKKEPVSEFQYRVRHANGEYRWFHTFGTVFSRNHTGEVENILNISLDITEKIKADEIVMQKTLELQQSNQSLEEFAFIASHDLKEPLRKISTLTDRLVAIENVNISADGQVYLQKVISSSIRMQRMIDELLALAQVTSDRDYQEVNLQTVLSDVLQTFDQKIEETGAKVISKGLPTAMVVPSQFRQLFQNLISNSLKFRKTDRPTQIEITHEYLSSNTVALHNLQPAGRYLQLTFSDNGIGFDNRFLPKIFSIFQRLHPRNKYEGTGIGLSICKKIVENHGGVIIADGMVDQGATFKIIVPDKLE